MQSIEAKTYPNIVVVVGIIQHPVTKKFLITKRSKGQHLAGLWEFPGGKVEQGEDLFHALQRELVEEVDINIQSAFPLKKISHQYQDKIVSLNFWVVTHFNGEVSAQEKQELEWVGLDDLNKYEFPEANQPIIKSLNLPFYWMITPNCDVQKIEEYIHSIKQATSQFCIKQILFRSKNLEDNDYFLVYEKLKMMTSKSDCHIILNREKPNNKLTNYWHLTSTQLHEYSKRPFKKGFLSASCHTIKDIKQAEKIGIDFIVLSSVAKTPSHPKAIPLGWYQFKQLAEQTTLPVYALGGVSRENLTVARYHGAIGVAGISTFFK